MSTPTEPYGPPPGSTVLPSEKAPGPDGFAVASLVLSLVGGALLSVVLGVVALNRIRRTGQGGRRLALAGLAISALWIAGATALTVRALTAPPVRAAGGQVQRAAQVDVDDLRAGDCVVTLPDASDGLRRVDAVPCTTAHAAEVITVVDLPDGRYPGDQQVLTLTREGCRRFLPDLADAVGQTVNRYYSMPTGDTWRHGDHGATCFVELQTPATRKLLP